LGIEIPKSVEHALEIDCKTGKDHWRRAITKEMKNVRIAVECWNGDPVGTNDGSTPPIGFKEIHCHMIFDVKMDREFMRKACFVAGGHTMEVPSSSTYSSIVSRESIWIAFLVAALNDLNILAADIGNAYLNAPCHEKYGHGLGKSLGAMQDA